MRLVDLFEARLTPIKKRQKMPLADVTDDDLSYGINEAVYVLNRMRRLPGIDLTTPIIKQVQDLTALYKTELTERRQAAKSASR